MGKTKYKSAIITVVEDGKAIEYPYSEELEQYLIEKYLDEKREKRKKELEEEGECEAEYITSSNPCYDCNHECFFNCPKVIDVPKHDITEYPFITEGYQIKDLEKKEIAEGRTVEQWVTKKFVVSINGCENYVKQIPSPPPTREEREIGYSVTEALAGLLGIKVPERRIYNIPRSNKGKVKKKTFGKK